MPAIVPLVEGVGEVHAVPLLLRRLLQEEFARYDWQVAKPKCAHGCGNLLAAGGLERFIQYAQSGGAAVLVLVDGDSVEALPPGQRPAEDCAPGLAQLLAQRAAVIQPQVPVVIVVATWEYEAWFLASIETMEIAGLNRYQAEMADTRSPKGWIERHLPPGQKYLETLDQAKMTNKLDFRRVEERSRSFRRLKNALNQLLEAHSENRSVVTPYQGIEA